MIILSTKPKPKSRVNEYLGKYYMNLFRYIGSYTILEDRRCTAIFDDNHGGLWACSLEQDHEDGHEAYYDHVVSMVEDAPFGWWDTDDGAGYE